MIADIGLPLFMTTTRYERPAFRPLDLLPAMAVKVTEPGHGRGFSRTFTAKVIRKARVMVELEQIGQVDRQPRRWTMRLDTQRQQGGEGNYVPYFRTIGQYEYDRALTEARAFLAEQGIRVQHDGRWADNEIMLARLIWPRRKGS